MLLGVATIATPSVPETSLTVSPDATELPPTVIAPKVLSYSKVTLELSLAATKAKLFNTNLFSVLLVAVVIVIVISSPGLNVLLNVPDPLALEPSITNLLTEVAVQSNEISAVESEVFSITIVAVLELAPKPKTPLEPCAVTVTVPLDSVVLVAPLTLTFIYSANV